MVGAELGLEPVHGASERAGHDAGIGDHQIERLGLRHQRDSAGTHAGERGKVEFDQLEPAAVGHIGANLTGRTLRLGQVARGADDIGAMAASTRAVSMPIPAKRR